MTKYYLAYGSNLNLLQMAYRCPTAKVVGQAFLKGYELNFKGSKTGSYLTIDKKENREVPVGVFSVTRDDEKTLDRYEGYPNFYFKKDIKLKVKTKVGIKSLDCFVYIMRKDAKVGRPSKHYFDVCLEGYEDFGFDESYLYDALERSYGNEESNND